MVKKILFFAVSFYLLTLFQLSFLPPIVKSSLLNLPLIFLVFISLFFELEKSLFLAPPFFCGFFLDLFSPKFFGFWILISFLLYFLIKIIKTYVRIPSLKKI